MKTKEDLKNTYIEIRGNKKLSKAVQEKLFEIGFKWHGDDKAIYYDMQASYMIMDEDFDLTECDVEIIEHTKIYPEDLGLTDDYDDDELERGITITNVDKPTEPVYGQEVWVSDKEDKDWEKRYFLGVINGIFCTFNHYSEKEDFESDMGFSACPWKYLRTTDPALDTKTLRQEFCDTKGWNYLEFDTLTEAEEYILFLENKLKGTT